MGRMRGAAAPSSESDSHAALPKPPASTPSSTVTSSSWSAASDVNSGTSSGFAKGGAATGASPPAPREKFARGERLADAGAVPDERDPLALTQDLAGADAQHLGFQRQVHAD